MKDIISPVNKDLLKSELTEDKFLRYTNNGGNELYIINAFNAPNLMKEIGRLREETFRSAGGGTGKAIDIDALDDGENSYEQLIAWDPDSEEIIGGYRFFVCNQNTDPKELATYKLFSFTEEFVKNYMPYTIELGRSFIQPDYQSSMAKRKALYALDNLWDGLGALVIKHPQHKYFFGKVTMYPHFNRKARDLILYFLHHEFVNGYHLVSPYHPLPFETDEKELQNYFTASTYEQKHKILTREVRKLGENVPPLINAYMNLSKTMMIFGTAINKSFGYVEETGIMVILSDIYPQKMERHVQSYLKDSRYQ
ncbi:MAG: GNAT family N-acetyltransferase [Bacteroidales bacterium]